MINESFKKSFQKILQAGYISLSITVVSCDRGPTSTSNTSTISNNNETDEVVITDTSRFVDPVIRPYLDSFIQELVDREISADLSNITMVFVDAFADGFIGISQGGSVGGVCYPSSGLLQLDSFFIDNPSFLLEIIYHELGHCVLGMDHRDNSLMSSDIPRSTPALINELFSEEYFYELNVLSRPGELEEPHAVTLDHLDL